VGVFELKTFTGAPTSPTRLFPLFAAELRFDKRLIIDVGDYRRLNGVIAGLMGD
jgi:hypothetical protein